MIKEAHAAQASIAVALTTSPVWVSILQQVNLILSTAACIMGLVVGVITIYQALKHTRSNSLTRKDDKRE